MYSLWLCRIKDNVLTTFSYKEHFYYEASCKQKVFIMFLSQKDMCSLLVICREKITCDHYDLSQGCFRQKWMLCWALTLLTMVMSSVMWRQNTQYFWLLLYSKYSLGLWDQTHYGHTGSSLSLPRMPTKFYNTQFSFSLVIRGECKVRVEQAGILRDTMNSSAVMSKAVRSHSHSLRLCLACPMAPKWSRALRGTALPMRALTLQRFHHICSSCCCCRSARQTIHIQIDQCRKPDGSMRYILGKNSKAFETIPSMIDHYTRHVVPIRGADHMTLLHPVQCHWSQAGDVKLWGLVGGCGYCICECVCVCARARVCVATGVWDLMCVSAV